MRKILLLLFLVIIVIPAFCQNLTISGRVTYKNSMNSTLDSCLVTLFQNGIIVDTDSTDNDGMYSFDSLVPGIYTFQISCHKMIGGSAATDALITLRHFVGMPPLLIGLNLRVSDVNGDGYPNAIDALMMDRKFVGAILEFPHGDWVFDVSNSVTITNISVIQNFKALCYGDTNGSFIPINSHPSNP